MKEVESGKKVALTLVGMSMIFGLWAGTEKSERPLTVVACGDAFMVQGFPAEYRIDPVPGGWIASGDARLVNFEAVVNDGTCPPSAWSGGTWAGMSPETFQDFLKYGFNGCGNANNHALDYSREGLLMTVATQNKAGLANCGVPVDSDAKTALNARSKGGKVGLHVFRENFLSVVPKLEIADGVVKRVTMLPIELYFGQDWSINGLPRMAPAKDAADIAANLTRLSAAYGTKVVRLADGTLEARAK